MPSNDRMHPGGPNDPVPFGKYYLLGLIARGGMAEVYRARRITDPTKLLAIKVMRPQLAREPRFIDMFNGEAKLAMMLRNRCIVETYEVGQFEGRHYIAMEYIAGRDLTQVLRRCQETQGRIPVPHAVYIAARIAEGLHFAHTLAEAGRPLNIVNRDVSPSNVRLSYDGQVKLLDFGIAQALMKFTSEIGILKGKYSYMSPEQIRGMPVDARTDVFSAGIILHEMLTTEKLFRGDTEFGLMEKVRKAEVPPPSNFNRRVTPDLDAISHRALARDVADRYQTAAQLAADLDALIAGYRFDPSELRQFMRQLFRKEYTRELEEMQLSLETEPSDLSTIKTRDLGPPPATGTPTDQDLRATGTPSIAETTAGTDVPTDPEHQHQPAELADPDPEDDPDPDPDHDPNRPAGSGKQPPWASRLRGILDSLFRKRR